MGKGFNNFMSKKDFHPGNFENIKKVWMAQQKEEEMVKRDEEMRIQYEKEQEMISNKALLGDEKAKLGLSFMYDAPAGFRAATEKEEQIDEPEVEPKFEWQRKYNAPRETWAKDCDAVVDQPFGIMVRNVRCVKCHKWGHTNTDNECPLYNMSGNYDGAGYSTNPSDLIRELRERQEMDEDDSDTKKTTIVRDSKILNDEMKTEYGLKFKSHVLDTMKVDDVMRRDHEAAGTTSTAVEGSHTEVKQEPRSQKELMVEFLKTMTELERSSIFQKLMCPGDKKKAKKSKKDKKKSKKRRTRDSSADDDQSDVQEKSSRKIKIKQEPVSDKYDRHHDGRSGDKFRHHNSVGGSRNSGDSERKGIDRSGHKSRSRKESNVERHHGKSKVETGGRVNSFSKTSDGKEKRRRHDSSSSESDAETSKKSSNRHIYIKNESLSNEDSGSGARIRDKLSSKQSLKRTGKSSERNATRAKERSKSPKRSRNDVNKRKNDIIIKQEESSYMHRGERNH